MGLLSRFVGMLTDSRSFLSYSRHEYFRRLLCNILGSDVEKGLLPHDTVVVTVTRGAPEFAFALAVAPMPPALLNANTVSCC